ncbi:MAG: EAL domain-containing protein [Pseudomonadota bacterium]|nr:EAL domain-containing protein [Pseudomonadota bacterium]MDP1902820.1 EAL domain-containing protein [Pseudomonadota bacterium]MDP2351303.1 EAL domain-containing protein [Pseudomonadota bacterium]
MNSIDIFPWDDNFNTGLPKVDEQHRRLAQLLNHLASQVAFTPDSGQLDLIFDELANYAVYHFDTEEAIWRAFLPEDPMEIGHRAVHAQFIDTVRRLKEAQRSRPIAEVAEETLGFLARWLASHILETDRHMAYIVLALQAGLDLAAAKRRAGEQMAGTTRALIDIILSIYGTLSTNTLRLMREIHDHHQVSAALRASENRMRDLFEKAPLAYQSLDPQGHLLEVNALWLEQMGYPRDEVIGRRFCDFIANDATTPRYELPVLQEAGETDGAVFEMIRKDGSRFLWQLNDRIGHDAQGHLERTHCLLTDISERLEARDKLRTSEKRLHDTLNSAPNVAVQWFDREGRIVYWNVGSENLFGWNSEAVLGKRLDQFMLTRKEAAAFLKAIDHIDASGEIVGPLELSSHDLDGTPIFIESSLFAIQGDKPDSKLFVCMDVDITGRKLAEQRLRHLGEYQELLLALSTSFINLPLEQIDSAIQDGLGKMAQFVSADRAYLFDYDFAQGTTSNTHEWCAPGVTPQLEILQGVPLEGISEWVGAHRKGEIFLVQDVSELPPGSLRDILAPQAIKSLMTLPLMHVTHCLGFVGFDAVKQRHEFVQEEIQLLGLFAKLLVHLDDRRRTHSELAYERGFLKTLIQTIPDLVWLKDPEGRYLACNARFERFFAAAEANILGKRDADFIDRELAEVFRGHDRRALDDAAPSHGEAWITFADDGHHELLETTHTPMSDEHGRLIGVLGIGHDITDRKLGEDSLRLAASVFSHAREGIMITAPNGDILDVNTAFTHITGYSREEVLGKTPRILNSGRQPRDFYIDMWRDLMEQGHWYGEVWNRRKNGEIYAQMQTIGAVRDEQGKTLRYVSLFSDITPLKEYQSQLEHIAHFDLLTGLPNRSLLADRMHQALALAQRQGTTLAVVYLDLDGFKAVNDSHGHETGDKLLTLLAGRMKQALRDGDTLSRLGGDEFVAVLLDLADHQGSLPILARLLSAVAEPAWVEGIALKVSASLGVAFYQQADEVDADQLLRQADQAMYTAKQAGKNRYHIFDAEQDRHARGQQSSLERIRQALAEDEFVLHYQPKVNMRSGRMIGAEALIRWRHPERGLLPPAAFLPVIDNHPLSIEVGNWVLERALCQIDAWKRDGIQVPVSVNIDALQLQQQDFVEQLRARLAAHPGIQPGDLELEVLETSALADISHASAIISACREIGIGFALDDFGTGYSSLTYLKRLPAHLLKIDQSFVRDMRVDPEDLAILEGVLGLASAFRRQVIAEGVETAAHGEMLLQLGCELGQGFAIARPMPAEAIPEWIAGWRPDASWLNQAPIGRDDFSILLAGVELHAWTLALSGYLNGERATPPALSIEQCRFGQWLIQEGAARHAGQPGFVAIEALHRELHECAETLLELNRHGQGEKARSRFSEILGLREALQAHLRTLIGSPGIGATTSI